ncbi:MAG: WD40 repeat domain-containing protein, partial [Actinomadura sp.]
MSTDLYGARVLGVAPDRMSLRIRVFVIYYEVAARHAQELPDDPAFFLRLLWDRAREDSLREVPDERPLAELDLDWLLDEGWMAAHTGSYVRRVERVAERNAVPEPADWERLHDFYYERAGGWLDEHRLVQADYVVWVTDPRWLAGVEPGHGWATTWYPSPGMRVRPADGPYVPRFSEPVAVVMPFADRSGSGQYSCDLAFSDDGSHLAVAGQEGDVLVYDTGDWTERARFGTPHSLMGPRLMWVPGRHVITARAPLAYDQQVAWDVDAGAEVDAPLELGFVRSRTGRYRVEYAEVPGVEFVSAPFTPERTVLLGLDAEADASDAPPAAAGVGFSADESRMFALCTDDEHARFSVLDPETGRVLGAVGTSATMVMDFAVSPDGAYLAIAEATDALIAEPTIRRVADGGELVLRAGLGLLTGRIDWSPDGRLLAVDLHPRGDGPSEVRIFPVGAIAPAQARATPDVERAEGVAGEVTEALRRAAAGEDPSAGPHAAVVLAVLDRAAGTPDPVVRGIAAERTGDLAAACASYESATGPA